MKNLMTIAAFSLLLGACGNANKNTDVITSEPVADRTKYAIDSVNSVRALEIASMQRQKSIDSMSELALEKQSVHHHSSNNNTHIATDPNTNSGNVVTNTTPTPEEKKKMNNKTKGAIIGAGTGAVLGAVTGVIVDGKKGEGAVVGGLIGAAAGAGAGAAIGNSKDKKKAASTSTVK